MEANEVKFFIVLAYLIVNASLWMWLCQGHSSKTGAIKYDVDAFESESGWCFINRVAR